MKHYNLVKQMGNARFFITRSSSTLEEYRLACKVMKLGREEEFEEKKFTRIEVNIYGTKKWYLGDKLHRRDGPAIEWESGNKMWYVKGKRHRVDGPAIEHKDGKKWYYEGKLHRLDGPAVEDANGTKEWWVKGRHLKWAVS